MTMGGYERRLSLGLQFEHEMLGKINKYAYERAYAIMKKAGVADYTFNALASFTALERLATASVHS